MCGRDYWWEGHKERDNQEFEKVEKRIILN
jgi:hypothetical protein